MDRRHPARLMRHAAQRTCRRSMRTATAALVTTMSRPSSLAGSHRVSLPISSQGAARDCALSLTWSGRAAENAGLLKRQHRSRSQRRFPEDALVANVGCRRVSPVRRIPAIVSFLNPQPALRLVSGNRSSCPNPAIGRGLRGQLSRVGECPSSRRSRIAERGRDGLFFFGHIALHSSGKPALRRPTSNVFSRSAQ